MTLFYVRSPSTIFPVRSPHTTEIINLYIKFQFLLNMKAILINFLMMSIYKYIIQMEFQVLEQSLPYQAQKNRKLNLGVVIVMHRMGA